MNIVVISPHPDDETLGAGGMLLRLKKEGHRLFWINITNVNRNGCWSQCYDEKKKQISKVISRYDFDDFFDLGMEPCSLNSVVLNDLIRKIGECFNKIKPEWIILPNPEDAHSDHRYVYEAAMSCSKIFRYPFIKRIMVMEVPSETDFSKHGTFFSPNYFIDITETIEEKIKIMMIYETELGQHPFPRSIENIRAWGTVRGAMAGVSAAEAFRIIKWID